MGKLIVIEGLDGSGKSTQFDLLIRRFAAEQIQVHPLSFPDYASDSSALIRMYLRGDFGTAPGDVNSYAASAFYSVDRYASYKTAWERSYLAGARFIAARYTTSNMIYQLAKLEQSQWDAYLAWLEDLEYVKMGIPRPDLVLYLDVPVDLSQQLLSKRYHGDDEKKDIHERDLLYLKQCAQAAAYAACRNAWTIVPCAENGALRSVESIHEEIAAIIRRFI